MKEFWANPFYRFVALFIFLYGCWHALYKFVLQPFSRFDEIVVSNIVAISKWVLSKFGYSFSDLPEHVHLIDGIVFSDGVSGVSVGKECDGIVLLALFLVFILSFPGPIKHKLWFGPVGLVIVHLVNVSRVISLALIHHHAPSYLEFNHDYTFTLIVYGLVFGLWYYWIVKWAKK